MFAVTLFSCCQAFAQDHVKDPRIACSRTYLTDSATVDQFVFNAYRNDNSGESCLRVLQNGEIIFQRTNDNGGGYTIGQKANSDNHIPAIANGTDLTGRGNPDVTVSEYTGGAHCCLIQYIFELKPVFRLLATIDAEDDDLSHFSDLDRNGRYYYLTADWSFSYWPSSFAGSPVSSIILRYITQTPRPGYHLATDKMKKPPPNPAEWTNQVWTARGIFNSSNGSWEQPNGDFWQMLVDYIYFGNARFAWKLVSEAWPPQVPKKDEWVHDFCAILKSSSYFPDLDQPLDGAPPACISARPGSGKR